MKANIMKIAKTLFVLTAVVFGMFILTVKSKSSLDSPFLSRFVPPLQQSDGAKIYSMSCARCHGSDGKAKTAKGKQTGAVDLTSDEWEPNDARDTRIINNGKGPMPGFKNKHKPAEINSVVVYIRRFKG